MGLVRRRLLAWAALGGMVLSVFACRSTERHGPAPEVRLQTLDEAKFTDNLTQYRGKVVLVDYWALWCSPCKELFPHTVQLHRELAGRGLAVVSISLDPAEKEPEVREFLVAQQATFDNFIASHDVAEAVDLLQIENGTLPHLKLFDREGKLWKTFPKAQSAVNPAEVEEAVKELLGG